MSFDFDPDRLDRRAPALIAGVLPWLQTFSRRYLRLRVAGVENIPRDPTMFVANHNGGIMGPDLFCTLPLLWDALGPDAPLYALAHDFAMRQVVPLGALLQRAGAIAASRLNAARVFAMGGSVLVYPGGDLDAYRPYHRRDEVVVLPRSGFIDVARAADVAIVPIVAQGAHRSAYVLSEGRDLARWLRLHRWARVERFPIALALPWGIALGPWLPYFPLPFQVKLRVLPAIRFTPDVESSIAAAHVESVMQAAMHEMRAS